MKKYAVQLTLVVLVLLCSNIYAQKITIGAKGGFSIPNLTAGSSQNPLNSGYSSRLGADYGIYGEYHLSGLFSLSLGIEYSSQGGIKDKFQAFSTPPAMAALVTAPYVYADFKSEAKINYLLVPVLARFSWNFNKSGPVKLYAAVGPFAGFLLNAHQVTSGSSIIYMDETKTIPLTTEPQSFDNNNDIKSDLYTFNLGVDGFVGISYSLTPKHALFIEVGGNYGFLSIQKGTVNGKNFTGAGVATLGYAYSF